MQGDANGYGADGRFAVQSALADAGLTWYDPDGERNPVVLSTRKAALALIDYERAKFAVNTPVYFGFGSTFDFNAFAHRTTHDVVCMNVGTMLALWNTMNFLLSDPRFLPFLDGGSEAPLDPPPTSPSLWEHCTTSPTRHPKSKLRAELAGKMFVVSQYFVLTHELTHIFAGHVDLLHATASAVPYEEVRRDHEEPLPLMLYHAMEYESDAYGAIRAVDASVVNSFFERFDQYLDEIEDYNRNKNDISAELFFSFMAIYLSFRLLDETYKHLKLAGKSHPLASIRQSYISAVMPFHANRLKDANMTANRWVEVLYHCIKEVELAFGRFSNADYSLPDLMASAYVQALFSDTDEYMAELSKALNELENKVKRRGRGTFRELDLPRF